MLKIEELRIKNGFTQEELAKKINVSRQSISEWEKGNSTPNIDNLILLSKILKTSLDYLITGSESSYISTNVSSASFLTLSKKNNGNGTLIGKLNGQYAYLENDKGINIVCGSSGSGKTKSFIEPNVMQKLKNNEKCLVVNNSNITKKVKETFPDKKILEITENNLNINLFKDIKDDGDILLLYDTFLSKNPLVKDKNIEINFAKAIEYEFFKYLLKNNFTFTNIKENFSYNYLDGKFFEKSYILRSCPQDLIMDIDLSLKLKLNDDYSIVENGDLIINDLINYDFISINVDFNCNKVYERAIQYILFSIYEKKIDISNVFIDEFGILFFEYDSLQMMKKYIKESNINTSIVIQSVAQIRDDDFVEKADNLIFLGSNDIVTLNILNRITDIDIQDLLKLQVNELIFKRKFEDVIILNKI